MKLTKKQKEEQKQTSLAFLKEKLKPGDAVYTKLCSVSRSGMSRNVDVYIFQDNEPVCINRHIANITPFRFNDKHGCLSINGYGFDAGFKVVYILAHCLFPEGFTCIGKGEIDHGTKGCPSNDHSNGDQNYEPHHHEEGGYALYHRWF